jgi:hypothetical protein
MRRPNHVSCHAGISTPAASIRCAADCKLAPAGIVKLTLAELSGKSWVKKRVVIAMPAAKINRMSRKIILRVFMAVTWQGNLCAHRGQVEMIAFRFSHSDLSHEYAVDKFP